MFFASPPGSRLFPLLGVALSLLLGVGCESDSGDADAADTTDTSNLPDITNPPDGSENPDGCAVDLVSHQDATFRLTNVEINKPGGVGRLLQGLMNNDFENQRLHVLIDVRNFESACGTTELELTGNAGTLPEGQEPGSYAWFPGITPEYKPATMQEDGSVQNTEQLSLIFPALLVGSDDTIQIPVTDLLLTGQIFEQEGVLYIAGGLTGAILEADIADISVSLIPGQDPRPLPDLLGRGAMDYPVDAAVKTGWQLEASANGTRVILLED